MAHFAKYLDMPGLAATRLVTPAYTFSKKRGTAMNTCGFATRIYSNTERGS